MPSYSELLNHEHYVDETAYKAIKKVREEITMNAGDIYENENGKMYLIVASSGKIVTTIQLTDDSFHPMCVLSPKGAKFYNPSYIGYTFLDRAGEYIGRASDSEVREMRSGIAKALGIAEEPQEVKEVVKYVETPADTSEVTAVKTELKVYKELYEKLLERVMA